MKIKYLKIKNFLSIAEDAIEINFEKLGKIINVKGKNLDAEEGSSNGSGKTTILFGLIYGLYGKIPKNLTRTEVVNIRNKKGLEIEVHFDLQGKEYKIIRKRVPDSLTFICDGNDVSQSGLPSTDAAIQKIIKLNYESFINVTYFGQHNVKSFLSGKSEEKRRIAENLLSIDKYTDYLKKAKEKFKSVKDKFSLLSITYENLLNENTSIKRKQNLIKSQQLEWKNRSNNLISNLQSKILEKQKDINQILANKDVTIYEESQKELNSIDEFISKKEQNRIDLHKILEKVDNAVQLKRDEQQDLSIKSSAFQRDLTLFTRQVSAHEEECNNFREKQGGTCDQCLGDITEHNVKRLLDIKLDKIKKIQVEWKEAKLKKELVDKDLEICNKSLTKFLEGRKAAKEKEIETLSTLNSLLEKKRQLTRIEKPDIINQVNLINKDLEHLKEKLTSTISEQDPYVEMFSLVEEELVKNEYGINLYKKDLKSLEDQLPYYEFWVKAFGDGGIRCFVIDEIIPALNSRINYWLECLMEGKIQLHFNNQLEETIERKPVDNDPFVYNSLSGGEICRTDFSIALAFSSIIMLNSNIPSIVFLDEIGTNLDSQGILSVYKVICELANDRQVMVVTHDPNLQALLENNCDVLTVIKKNGISKLEF